MGNVLMNGRMELLGPCRFVQATASHRDYSCSTLARWHVLILVAPRRGSFNNEVGVFENDTPVANNFVALVHAVV